MFWARAVAADCDSMCTAACASFIFTSSGVLGPCASFSLSLSMCRKKESNDEHFKFEDSDLRRMSGTNDPLYFACNRVGRNLGLEKPAGVPQLPGAPSISIFMPCVHVTANKLIAHPTLEASTSFTLSASDVHGTCPRGQHILVHLFSLLVLCLSEHAWSTPDFV